VTERCNCDESLRLRERVRLLRDALRQLNERRFGGSWTTLSADIALFALEYDNRLAQAEETSVGEKKPEYMGPECFGGSDEGSHYMSQERIDHRATIAPTPDPRYRQRHDALMSSPLRLEPRSVPYEPVWEPESEPVCKRCNDTHVVDAGDRGRLNCTHCPTPCKACRKDGIGAYCGRTPCDCACHRKNEKPEPPASEPSDVTSQPCPPDCAHCNAYDLGRASRDAEVAALKQENDRLRAAHEATKAELAEQRGWLDDIAAAICGWPPDSDGKTYIPTQLAGSARELRATAVRMRAERDHYRDMSRKALHDVDRDLDRRVDAGSMRLDKLEERMAAAFGVIDDFSGRFRKLEKGE
jgi:hypothetical protein